MLNPCIASWLAEQHHADMLSAAARHRAARPALRSTNHDQAVGRLASANRALVKRLRRVEITSPETRAVY